MIGSLDPPGLEKKGLQFIHTSGQAVILLLQRLCYAVGHAGLFSLEMIQAGLCVANVMCELFRDLGDLVVSVLAQLFLLFLDLRDCCFQCSQSRALLLEKIGDWSRGRAGIGCGHLSCGSR